MKTTLLFVALLSPVFAQAESFETTCMSRDKSLVLEVSLEFEGSFAEMPNEAAAQATVKIVRRKGQTGTLTLDMTGTANSSAKGPYYELNAEDGTSLMISAPASGSPSEFTVKGKTTFVTCD